MVFILVFIYLKTCCIKWICR